MNCRAFSWTLRLVAVLILAVGSGAQAQAPSPTHLGGIINDYTAATGVSGPSEMHGSWVLGRVFLETRLGGWLHLADEHTCSASTIPCLSFRRIVSGLST